MRFEARLGRLACSFDELPPIVYDAPISQRIYTLSQVPADTILSPVRREMEDGSALLICTRLNAPPTRIDTEAASESVVEDADEAAVPLAAGTDDTSSKDYEESDSESVYLVQQGKRQRSAPKPFAPPENGNRNGKGKGKGKATVKGKGKGERVRRKILPDGQVSRIGMINARTKKPYDRDSYAMPGQSAGGSAGKAGKAVVEVASDVALKTLGHTHASEVAELKSRIRVLDEKLGEYRATISSEPLRIQAAVESAKFHMMAGFGEMKEQAFIRGMNAVLRIEKKEEVLAPVLSGERATPLSACGSGS